MPRSGRGSDCRRWVPALAATWLIACAQLVAPQDLLPNGGFEADADQDGQPDRWFPWGAGEVSLIPDAHSGRNALRLADRSTTEAAGLLSDLAPARPLALYHVTGFVRLERGTFYLYLEFYDAQAARLAGATAVCPAHSDWVRVELDTVAPPDTTRVRLLLHSPTANTGSAVFDDLRLSEEELQSESWEVRPAGRPRVLLTRDSLPRLRRSGFRAERLLSETKFSVDYYGGAQIAFDLPPRMPGRLAPPAGWHSRRPYPYWTAMSRSLEGRLQDLVVAYLASDDERYAQRAREYVLALAAWPAWTDPQEAAVSWSTAHLAMGVCVVYDALYDQLQPEERRRIERALRRNALGPMIPQALARSDDSFTVVRNAALGLTALNLLDSDPDGPQYLTLAKNYFLWYLDDRLRSPRTAGLGYDAFAVDHAALFADALNRVTGDSSVLRHPYLHDVAPYLATYFLLPGFQHNVNFEDHSGGLGWFITMNAVAREFQDGLAAWYLQATGLNDRRDFYREVLGRPQVLPDAPTDLPPSRAFPRIGWAALRSDWSEDGTLLAFVSSSSDTRHNHRAQNDFILNVAGQTLLADPGLRNSSTSELAEFTAGSRGHNTILVDGQGQTRLGGGKIVDFYSSPRVDYVAGQAADAYEPGLVSSFLRRIAYVRPHYFLIRDELEAAEAPRMFSSLLHASLRGRILINGMDAGVDQREEHARLQFTRSRCLARVDILAPQRAFVQVAEAPDPEKYGRYAIIEPPEKTRRAEFMLLVRPERLADDPNAYVAEELLRLKAPATSREVQLLPEQDLLFFRGTEPGDQVVFHLSVNAPGEYKVLLSQMTYSSYGIYQWSLDGRPLGEPVDAYDERPRLQTDVLLGLANLTEGPHRMTATLVGKNERATNFYLGLSGIVFQPMQGPAAHRPEDVPWQIEQARSGPAEARVVTIAHGDNTDVLIFGRQGRPSTGGGIATDAAFAWLLLEKERPLSLGFCSGTRIALGGEALFNASAPLSVALSFPRQDTVEYRLTAKQPTQVYLARTWRKEVELSGTAKLIKIDDQRPVLDLEEGSAVATLVWHGSS